MSRKLESRSGSNKSCCTSPPCQSNQKNPGLRLSFSAECVSPSTTKKKKAAGEQRGKKINKCWSQLPLASSHIVPATESAGRRRVRDGGPGESAERASPPRTEREDTGRREKRRGTGKAVLKSLLANATRGEGICMQGSTSAH